MDKTPDEHTCVVGLAWGDEGKGKIVDLLAQRFDFVVRYNGGANAGHTVRGGEGRFALHQLPIGVLHEGLTGVIGPGVVVDPVMLFEEIDALETRGVPVTDRLKISERAHLVMPYHKIEDRFSESGSRKSERIGTTERGIGPCYADKMLRTTAIRVGDLFDLPGLEGRLGDLVQRKQRALRGAYGQGGGFDLDDTCAHLRAAAQRIGPMIENTTNLLARAAQDGKRLLFEGANGMHLDVDHGTYPFVTSSHTGPAGVAAGAGVPPSLVSRYVGVTKCYTTRVGGGPFPTEQANEIGEQLRERGGEYGTTTGRPRRCGWLDLVAVRDSVRIGGITDVVLTHLDTLGGFEKINVCVGYRVGSTMLDGVPARADVLADVEPVYETLDGWRGDLADCGSFDALPDKARAFVHHAEAFLGAGVSIVSVGADRDQTIFRSTFPTANGGGQVQS